MYVTNKAHPSLICCYSIIIGITISVAIQDTWLNTSDGDIQSAQIHLNKSWKIQQQKNINVYKDIYIYIYILFACRHIKLSQICLLSLTVTMFWYTLLIWTGSHSKPGHRDRAINEGLSPPHSPDTQRNRRAPVCVCHTRPVPAFHETQRTNREWIEKNKYFIMWRNQIINLLSFCFTSVFTSVLPSFISSVFLSFLCSIFHVFIFKSFFHCLYIYFSILHIFIF